MSQDQTSCRLVCLDTGVAVTSNCDLCVLHGCGCCPRVCKISMEKNDWVCDVDVELPLCVCVVCAMAE